jgi:hypothetical protein
MSTSKVPSPDFNNGTQPKEFVPLVTETSNKKVDAASFSLTPGVGTDGLNPLSGSKKDGSSTRQWVANTPASTHSLLPINVEGPGKPSNHGPSGQTSNVEHAVPSSEAIPPHLEIQEPHFANIIHPPPIPHATAVPESSLASSQVEIAPQIKIRHSLTADGIKQGMEVPLSSKTPISSGAPETAAVAIPLPASQTLSVRPKASFGKGPAGASNAKFQPRNKHNESPETKLLKVDDVPVSSFATSSKVRSDDFDGQTKKRSPNRESPRIKKVEPALTRVLKGTDEPGKWRPSSKESPKKATATIGDEGVSKQDVQVAVHVVSSRQDNTEQSRSSKLSTQQLPVIAHQTAYNSDAPQPRIQHPVLAELLSSPQAPVAQLTPLQVSDKGYPKEGNTVPLTNPSIQSRLHGTPPDRYRQELEQKMQLTKEAAPISRSSHRKNSGTTFHSVEHHQVRTAADVVPRAKLARTSDQIAHDQRRNAENSIPSQPPQGSRITTQESNFRTSQIPESQRGTASRPAQQPLQHIQGRHQHSASLPTSSTVLENPVQELPRSMTPSAGYAKHATQGRPIMGRCSFR